MHYNIANFTVQKAD